MERKAGILLHPTSLPGTAGIGTLGKNAFEFIDWLEKAGMKIWQVLPLGPTGYGDSPYQSFSTFALNPLLIDFEDLVVRGWANKKDTKKPSYIKMTGKVDFGAVVWWKSHALKEIAKSFLEIITNPEATTSENYDPNTKAEFFAFCRENQYWLKDYAAFTSIKSFYDAKAAKEAEAKRCAVPGTWNVYWDKELSKHDEKAVEKWVNEHTEDFLQTEVIQFFAAKQWAAVHEYAKSKGIQIVGDIPIFVAADSSDVWANQGLFKIGSDGQFSAVAGVPPDYFSATGQLWGNPLYDWDAMKKDGYAWWIARIKKMLSLVDCVRIDHFRGFESYWAVPFGSLTAETGKWEKGPGIELFDAIKKELGELPLIAEDLGIITEEVRALRDDAKLPGMKVLQFAFDKNEWKQGSLKNVFLPHNFETTNCVAYTGTHDNDTTQGLFESLDDESLVLIADYLTGEKNSVEKTKKLLASKKLTKAFVKSIFASTASIAVVPLQDVYTLGTYARMNTPSTSGTNWAWRAEKGQISGTKAEKAAAWLKNLCVLYAR
ncbi:MAG: 4-alpha-glucanotransferase [Treponema sp.]|uniref:4-alpha-glucanotransferase n=1 Tax=Treponema sp. TaxID=166 RepID=UPI0025E342E4|nr:4-alpha-glucanotransferase [Treponema sp.]MBR0494733.1 4-alpha-glucanotransferase [Treponema sp.]